MQSLVLHPTSTAQWRELVQEAAHRADRRLDEEIESYLVFLLMRFTGDVALASRTMALEYLDSVLASGRIRRERLRDVGDQCLLFSGLFPRMARRRHVQIRYFVDLGRGAYDQLAAEAERGLAAVFRALAEGFVPLMDVLQTMRRMDADTPLLDPLEAYELWAGTGSRAARAQLAGHTGAEPAAGGGHELN